MAGEIEAISAVKSATVGTTEKPKKAENKGQIEVFGNKASKHNELVEDVTTYKIQKGDTLSEIAKEHGVSLKALMAANGLKDSKIKAGKELIIPVKLTPEVDTTKVEKTPEEFKTKPMTQEETKKIEDINSYLEKKGETRIKITPSSSESDLEPMVVIEGTGKKRWYSSDITLGDIKKTFPSIKDGTINNHNYLDDKPRYYDDEKGSYDLVLLKKDDKIRIPLSAIDIPKK